MQTQEEFLSQVPHLTDIPWEWEGQNFYFADTSFGILCILAFDPEEAEKACLTYFGQVSGCSLRSNDGGLLISNVPMNWLGPCQYLDATLVLHGDPCISPMRSPDSSPALTSGEAFAIDACQVHTHEVPRTQNYKWLEKMRDIAENRDEFLRSRSLLKEK